MRNALPISALVIGSAVLAATPAHTEPTGKPLADVVQGTEKGKLTNPHKGNKEAADAGHKLYMSAGCNGCHGGTGGGGMGPPLTNAVWVYGKDDDTLFRLITLGSQDLAKAGYSRKGTEGVVGPMPPFKDIIKSDDELWKVITWIQSLGGPKQ